MLSRCKGSGTATEGKLVWPPGVKSSGVILHPSFYIIFIFTYVIILIISYFSLRVLSILLSICTLLFYLLVLPYEFQPV